MRRLSEGRMNWGRAFGSVPPSFSAARSAFFLRSYAKFWALNFSAKASTSFVFSLTLDWATAFSPGVVAFASLSCSNLISASAAASSSACCFVRRFGRAFASSSASFFLTSTPLAARISSRGCARRRRSRTWRGRTRRRRQIAAPASGAGARWAARRIRRRQEQTCFRLSSENRVGPLQCRGPIQIDSPRF